MLRFLSLFLLAFCMIGCSDAADSSRSSDNQKYGGTLVTNQFNDFESLFPPASFELGSGTIGTIIYETLVGYDTQTKELIPLLAESWTHNEDFTEYTLSIRQGVTFHDDPVFADGRGRELEVEDVMYCLEFLCENNGLNRNSNLLSSSILGGEAFFKEKSKAGTDALEGLKKGSGNTIIIKLAEPDTQFLYRLTVFATSIYPRELIKKYSYDLNSHAIGTGPFKGKTMRSDVVYILDRNANYWGRDDDGQPLPYLDGIKINFSKKGSEIASSMRNSQMDLVVNADLIEGGDKVMAICEEPESGYVRTSDMEGETVFLGFLHENTIFSDVMVRQAFALAIDRESICDGVLQNSGSPARHGIVPTAFQSYPSKEVEGYKLDVEKAQALLAEAGYPEGKNFPVTTLQIRNRYQDVVVAQEIQRQIMDNIGVALSITTLNSSQHFERLEEKGAVLWLDNWSADYLDARNFLDLLLFKNTPEGGNGLLNIYRYNNPTYDRMVSEASKIGDDVTRLKAYAAADDFMLRDAAIIPIYYENNYVVRHERVKDLASPFLGIIDFRRAYLQKES